MSIIFYCSDHTIEAYDILVALLESELGQLLANLRATGIGASDNTCSGHMIENGENNGIVPAGGNAGAAVNALSSHSPPCPSSSSSAIQSTSVSSGNNNNSNDNSPTGEHSKTPGQQGSTAAPIPSSSKSRHGQTNLSPSGTTLFVSTTTTTTTTAAFTPEEMDIRALIERANENRLTAENAARVLLSRFMVESPGSENNNCMVILPPAGDHHNHHHHGHSRNGGNHHGSPGQGGPPQPLPWEETSSCSQTLR